MKKLFLLSLLPLLLLSSGCAPTVEVNGRSYKALTAKQRAYLVAFSRGCLKKNVGRMVEASEYEFARKNPPEIRIQYTGDCYGRAVIAWHLPRKTLELRYNGDLLAEMPSVMLGISAPEALREGIQPDKSTY